MSERRSKTPLEYERNKLVSAVLNLPPESPDLPRVISQLLLDLIFVTEGTDTELALVAAYAIFTDSLTELSKNKDG